MTLKQFIRNCVEHNTLIRLWFKIGNNYTLVGEDDDDVSMEHQVLKNLGKFAKYGDNEVIGVTDILVLETAYPEAVNIVIK